jgi:hypothetical protein
MEYPARRRVRLAHTLGWVCRLERFAFPAPIATELANQKYRTQGGVRLRFNEAQHFCRGRYLRNKECRRIATRNERNVKNYFAATFIAATVTWLLQ